MLISDITYTKRINGVVSFPIGNLINANMLNNIPCDKIIPNDDFKITFKTPNLRYSIA